MATTTLGVKVDESVRDRLKAASEQTGLTAHALHKQALLDYLARIEKGNVSAPHAAAGNEGFESDDAHLHPPFPFRDFARSIQPQSVARAAITAAYRKPEEECVALLLPMAEISKPDSVHELARRLVSSLREKHRSAGVEGLLQEFSLSSQEGIALMCLAEALLRIPDRATRDALIRDKIANGDWKAHMGGSPSLFVNAATWGLVLTGKLVAVNSETSLSSALSRLLSKGGEPLVRKGVNIAMRMMGEQFVSGQSISEALANNRRLEARGFSYSYDMLGEAATTADDAQRYYDAYEQAIHAIGKASEGRGIYEGPGISIKLSALHPRYSRSQLERVRQELLPRLIALTHLARQYDIGINIDAEEADRLEISLDLLEALCLDPTLEGWNGIGFVVQAYQKRAPFVVDYLIDLARRSHHRLMVRLVKGAYWDTEIKRAQIDGLEGYPVYTRKVYTDLSYLACARKLLAAPDAVFPQFATHNAYTVAAIYHMAGQNFYAGQYEFQCLHGMGEPLYEQVVGKVSDGKLNRPCRIYAPVGTHETLLAYLVRRLLENGANTSFVNLVGDPSIPLERLVANPADVARSIHPPGAPHPRIPLPKDLFGRGHDGARQNSAGVDLSNEHRLASLAAALLASTDRQWRAAPVIDATESQWDDARSRPVLNPANHHDLVGFVMDSETADVERALSVAQRAGQVWQATPVHERASCLQRAAQMLEENMPSLLGLIIREAGKSLTNAIAEVREAVDFLRFYAQQAEKEFDNDTHRPLGTVLCISPWNFPLAIFLGQVSAALAAGNAVIAKPAEQTSLIAAEAVRFLHSAGIPGGVLQLLPGQGETVGAALVSHPLVNGVIFTGSTGVARSIAAALAQRLSSDGMTIPLIAETGGQNAMVVDSSALAEQVVGDVLTSACDSAGQRCSALRILCLQDDCADRLITMLRGAMFELQVGNPDRLSTDVGPVIDADAARAIQQHVDAMREAGMKVLQIPLPAEAQSGTFVPPTLIEIDDISRLKHEVFGPVLHVLRYRRDELNRVIDDINATGYGLTFGLHTRIDETVSQVAARIRAGNIYINRNIVGAVVGVQPFGGESLSGTGPKAGGPLYMYRLLSVRPPALAGHFDLAKGLPFRLSLPGPTGESNEYQVLPRGTVLCYARTEAGFRAQLDAVLKTGNRALFADTPSLREPLAKLDGSVRDRIDLVSPSRVDNSEFHAVLFEGDSDALLELNRQLASRDGPIVSVQGLTTDTLIEGRHYALEPLVLERAISTNTAAAGGNASLMTIG